MLRIRDNRVINCQIRNDMGAQPYVSPTAGGPTTIVLPCAFCTLINQSSNHIYSSILFNTLSLHVRPGFADIAPRIFSGPHTRNRRSLLVRTDGVTSHLTDACQVVSLVDDFGSRIRWLRRHVSGPLIPRASTQAFQRWFAKMPAARTFVIHTSP